MHNLSVQSSLGPGLWSRLGLRGRMGCSHDPVDVDGQAAPSCVLAWHFTTISVDGGGFDGIGTCARTFATTSVTYHVHGANACCFAHGNIGVDVVVAERDAREDVDVWEVVVPYERTEDQSETEVHAEGASAVAVSVGAGWRQQQRRMGRVVGEARIAWCQGEGRATCRGCAHEDQKVYARSGRGGCRALRGKAAHGASRLGNRTLRQLGRML